MNIIKKLDEYLLDRDRRHSDSHHPSAALECLRKMYYKRTVAVESDPIGAGSLWKMEIGNSIHAMITRFLEESGFDTIEEVAFKKYIDGLEHPISGRVDNLFVDEDDNVAGIEIKTSFGRGIADIQRRGEPKEEHLYQTALYLYCTDISRFYLVYIGRDNAYRTQFIIEKIKDQIFVNNVQTNLSFELCTLQFEKLELLMKENKTPPRQYDACIVNGVFKDKFQHEGEMYKSDWQCNYCQYKTKCWSETLDKEGKFLGEEKII